MTLVERPGNLLRGLTNMEGGWKCVCSYWGPIPDLCCPWRKCCSWIRILELLATSAAVATNHAHENRGTVNDYFSSVQFSGYFKTLIGLWQTQWKMDWTTWTDLLEPQEPRNNLVPDHFFTCYSELLLPGGSKILTALIWTVGTATFIRSTVTYVFNLPSISFLQIFKVLFMLIQF